ncbi:hypothetical protein VTK56DRAFT_8910 [Thermocarpiscus australiensis]
MPLNMPRKRHLRTSAIAEHKKGSAQQGSRAQRNGDSASSRGGGAGERGSDEKGCRIAEMEYVEVGDAKRGWLVHR